MISYDFLNEEIPVFDPEFFVLALPELISMEGKEVGDISLIFCSDEQLLLMNKKHLDHDYYTDVITFDYTLHNFISGDVFVSVDRVKENAMEYKTTFHIEMCRVVFHGTLHLCGYNDKTEQEILEMRAKEELYINHFVSRETK
jgi:rRNA maturation RNase YbeY